MSKPKFSTREEYLAEAVRRLAPLIEEHEAKMPEKWAISEGFPKGGFKNRPAIGECWDPEVSEEKISNMFISPILGDPIQRLGVVLHEMIHAAVGLKEKHAGNFRRVARAVGLKGKLTATFVEENTPLFERISKLSLDLGVYPGKPMKPRKQPTLKKWFLVKLVSPNDPSYKFTIAPRLIDEFGMPKDYLGDDMVPAEDAE